MRLFKKIVIWFVALLLALLLLAWWFPNPKQATQFEHLPWQIDVVSPQSTAVLGLVLGQTRLQDLTQHLPVPDIRLFVNPDGQRKVEAFYPNSRIPPFEANIVLVPEMDAAQLDALWAERTSERPMPSGARRYGLSDDALRSMGPAVVVEMSYVPRARWDADLIQARFGEPAGRLRLGDEQDWWLYPDKGLALMLPIGRGRVLMHYTTQERWPVVMGRLEQEGLRLLGLDREG